MANPRVLEVKLSLDATACLVGDGICGIALCKSPSLRVDQLELYDRVVYNRAARYLLVSGACQFGEAVLMLPAQRSNRRDWRPFSG